jgi:hypothetical protein
MCPPGPARTLGGWAMSGLGNDARFYNMVYIPSTLVEMADRLEGLPYAADAAQETRKVIEHLNAAIDQAAALGDLWHAIERWLSGDGQGESDVHAALAEYRAKKQEAQP